MKRRWRLLLPVIVSVILMSETAPTQEVGKRLLLDNEVVTVVRYTFPPGFRGQKHPAIANEFAYVLKGEFAVVTERQGKRVVKKGEIEYAAKGTIHFSMNESKRPAIVLVVLLKDR